LVPRRLRIRHLYLAWEAFEAAMRLEQSPKTEYERSEGKDVSARSETAAAHTSSPVSSPFRPEPRLIERGDRGGLTSVLLALQRGAGNRAVAGLLAPLHRGGGPVVVQRDNEAAFNTWFGSIPGAEGSLKAWLANPINAAKDRGGMTNWGITLSTYRARAAAAGLSPDQKSFEHMTPDQAKLIGRQFWRGALADKIMNDGVAIAAADWYWGAPNQSLFDALRGVLNDYVAPAPADADNAKVVELLNSFTDPNKLLVALTERRLNFHREVVRKNADQGVFLVGWIIRAVHQAWTTLGAEGTVELLEHRLEANEIEKFFARYLKPKDIADVHDAARKKLGGDSKVATLTRYRFRVFKFKNAVLQDNWTEAAFFSNGFKRADIKELLTWAVVQKGNRVRALLHDAATTTIGEGSQLAEITEPKKR
jgi:hypothetical protein